MRDNAVPQGWQQCRASDIWRKRKHLNLEKVDIEEREGEGCLTRTVVFIEAQCCQFMMTLQEDNSGINTQTSKPADLSLPAVPPICWKIMSYKSREPINYVQNDLSIFQSIEQILQLCPKLSCICLLKQKGKNLGFIPGSWIAVSSLPELLKLLDNNISFSKMFVWMCTPVSSV